MLAKVLFRRAFQVALGGATSLSVSDQMPLNEMAGVGLHPAFLKRLV